MEIRYISVLTHFIYFICYLMDMFLSICLIRHAIVRQDNNNSDSQVNVIAYLPGCIVDGC